MFNCVRTQQHEKHKKLYLIIFSEKTRNKTLIAFCTNKTRMCSNSRKAFIHPCFNNEGVFLFF